ncbi:MAG: 5'/3'-nucleotidase SurE [Ilumatobacteraceae bacterium]
MRILVSNDDGIDSIGLHVLTRALCQLDGEHEIVVVAPDREFSGAGASLGALHLIQPEVSRGHIDNCPADEIWAVSGPPALCVMFARLGAFGGPFDLVVAGINPGANVGRSVYHSGTIGAALTARNGNVSGVAVSQSVDGFGVEGQGWDEAIADQHWESAAAIGAAVTQALVDDLPSEPVVVNVNVPNIPLDEIVGWRHAEVGLLPPRAVATAALEPVPGHDDRYRVNMSWGTKVDLDPATDGGAVEHNHVAISYLSRLEHQERNDLAATDAALDAVLRG